MTPSPARSPRSWAGSGGGWGRPAATRHPSPARTPRSAASARRQRRGQPPARGGRAAHGSPGAACQPPSLPSCPSARPLRPRVGGRENGDGPALALSPAVPTSDSRRRPPSAAAGTVRPFPTAALHRRARTAARENPDGSAGGRRLGSRREGYARAGNPMRGRAPRAARVPIGRAS